MALSLSQLNSSEIQTSLQPVFMPLLTFSSNKVVKPRSKSSKKYVSIRSRQSLLQTTTLSSKSSKQKSMTTATSSVRSNFLKQVDRLSKETNRLLGSKPQRAYVKTLRRKTEQVIAPGPLAQAVITPIKQF